MIVFITEEYGFRYWRWNYPGSKERLIKDWKRGRIPLFSCQKKFRGSVHELKTFEAREGYEYDAGVYAHIFWYNDTYLVIDDERRIPVEIQCE